MAWSEQLIAELDRRAVVLPTARGEVQVGREGAGPPVLAIHGGPGGFDQALAWSRHLRAGGCEVIAPSRPGYLRTPLSSGPTPADQADLYAATLDALGIERVAVHGLSSGGASAVHFAARHPDRTAALLLDSAILLPYQPPLGPLQRATYENAISVWLTYQIGTRWPQLMTRFMISGLATGQTGAEKKAAWEWINCDPDRLSRMQEQFLSIAPRQHRAPGWANDLANEKALGALPFGAVRAPALIAHGANDAFVPAEHATTAADRIRNADLVFVAGGHHLLSLSRNYGPVARKQLELVHQTA